MSFELNIKCFRGVKLPHRSLAPGDPFCTVSFETQADREFFKRQLRWSAFRLVEAELDVEPDEEEQTEEEQTEQKGEEKKIKMTVKGKKGKKK